MSIFGKDLSAFSLEYFNIDYQAINSATPFASVNTSSHPATNSSELFNGNIRYMQTRLTDPTHLDRLPMLNAYKYDQLNRLKESRSYERNFDGSTWNPTAYENEYFNSFTYDAMGNIENQIRYSREGALIDDLTYHYQKSGGKLVRNRLYHLNDNQTNDSDFDDDIDNMLTFRDNVIRLNVNNNYNYDEEGRLVKDSSERISKIVWRVDGKVKEIQRNVGSAKWLKFDYDAMGNRIAKHVYNNTGTTHERSTYYILDAQGNQISTYDHEIVGGSAKFHLKERNIFGSSRIGSKQDSINILTATLSQNYAQVLGTKYYEFSNHLGNVLTVFSDVKIALDEDADYVVDGFRVPIRNTADYSPFGVQLDGRTIQSDFYRYGYQGSEKDDEAKGGGNSYTTFYRQLDPRVGRWFSVDPKMSAWESPYVSMGNNPIRNNDILGDTVTVDPSISNNKDYNKVYNTWATTKEGKKFLKDYDIGGKFEHISIEFKLSTSTLDEKTWYDGDVRGLTDTYIVDRKSKVGVRFPESSVYNAKNIVNGKDKASFLKLVVFLDITQDIKSNYHKAIAVNTIEHETQHIDIIVAALMKYGKIPLHKKQHEEMSKGTYLEDRFNNFREIKSLWKNDYDSKWKSKRSEDEYINDKINSYEW